MHGPVKFNLKEHPIPTHFWGLLLEKMHMDGGIFTLAIFRWFCRSLSELTLILDGRCAVSSSKPSAKPSTKPSANPSEIPSA